MKTVLVTCPPMLRSISHYTDHFTAAGMEPITPNVVQTMSESQLLDIVPTVDGWIIGDDPASAQVFRAGKNGRLRAAVKWGVGTDNVDFASCKELGIPIVNTPGAFGPEVADLAICYIIGLARHAFYIDRGVRSGSWPKPPGISLAGRTVALVGYGDIGKNVYKRLLSLELKIIVYDPIAQVSDQSVPTDTWPNRVEHADFIVFTCALTSSNRHMLSKEVISGMKKAPYIVNVARGPLIDESALENALISGAVAGAALDVFEVEPLPSTSQLRSLPNCILGSHNASNTLDAVIRTSIRAIDALADHFNQLKL